MGIAPFCFVRSEIMNASPLFVRTYDFLLWLIPHIQKFPRVYRFTLSERVQRLAFDFQDSIVAAAKGQGRTRLEKLRLADIQLEQLRVWIRFARDNQLFTIGQYEHAARGVSEMGRLLGAWLKQVRDVPLA
jgi:hypothetical protein